MKPFFKPEDFNGCHDYGSMAYKANALLQERGMPTWLDKVASNYDVYEFNGATHQALLVCIEELPKKPCEHESVHDLKTQTWLSEGKISSSYFLWECKHCGVKLKAKWEVAE
jgi:hypothetical protein